MLYSNYVDGTGGSSDTLGFGGTGGWREIAAEIDAETLKEMNWFEDLMCG